MRREGCEPGGRATPWDGTCVPRGVQDFGAALLDAGRVGVRGHGRTVLSDENVQADWEHDIRGDVIC